MVSVKIHMPRSSGNQKKNLKHNRNLKAFLYPRNLYKSQHQELRNLYCSAVLFYILVVINLITSISSLWLVPPLQFLSLLLLLRVLSVDQHYHIYLGVCYQLWAPPQTY